MVVLHQKPEVLPSTSDAPASKSLDGTLVVIVNKATVPSTGDGGEATIDSDNLIAHIVKHRKIVEDKDGELQRMPTQLNDRLVAAQADR